jgi:hypothetical protein
VFNPQFDRAMLQAVNRQSLTSAAWVRAQVSLCEIFGGQSGTRTGFSPISSVSPVNIIPPWLSTLVYYLGDKQEASWWQQFRDVVSSHRHKQQHSLISLSCLPAGSDYLFKSGNNWFYFLLQNYNTELFYLLCWACGPHGRGGKSVQGFGWNVQIKRPLGRPWRR